MQTAEEKGISKDRVLEVVEAALAAAYKKDYGKKGQMIRASFDEVAKSASFFLQKEVVDDTVREFVEEIEEDETIPGKEPQRESRAVREAEISDEEKIPR